MKGRDYTDPAMTNVLIVMSDTGGGHRAVSNAVAEAIARHEPSATTHIVDLFALGARRIAADRITRLYGPVIRRAPWLYGGAYHLTNGRRRFRLVSRLGDGPLVSRARVLLRTYKPDVIVSIHALVTRPLAKAIAAEGAATPLIAVIPDLAQFHRSYVAPGVDRYTAPTPEAVHRLRRFGVPADKVELTGLPVGYQFTRPGNTLKLREELGLAPDVFTVLLAGGGEGTGGLVKIVNEIDRADLPIQMIVVCGRNRHAFAALTTTPPRTPAKILGFITNMYDMIRASDVVVTKGGPQSIVECLVAGRPVLVTQTLPGQEAGNDRYVQQNGAGFRANTPKKVVEYLRRLSADPAELAAVSECARKLGHPSASDNVADIILGAIHR